MASMSTNQINFIDLTPADVYYGKGREILLIRNADIYITTLRRAFKIANWN